MDITHILRDILIVLCAAKAAAELAERIGIPAVVGEILAGLAIGPTVLGLVGRDGDVLRTLGEIGVILLLLDVGMEMDLKELGRVGRASMSVAVIGVVAPMVLGLGVMTALGDEFNTALFVGAALTATSVGITARVFGDLRALATTEARVVLGAAVADDVIGLIVLTVVVRLVTAGTVSLLSVLGIVALAVGFLVIGGAVGLRVAPAIFGAVERVSRSSGTLVALALAFTLAFAEIASAAKLAPIVGAFVAGIALAKTRQHERIRRELAPVGHLFIPVFFLMIGIDADVSAFGKLHVLGTAAVLLVVASVGKMVAAFGLGRTRADRLLVGFGMLPRGEVGLIFATIGLANGVLGADLYASLLLVVLVTTLVTPTLLKMRFGRLRSGSAAKSAAEATSPVERPAQGWVHVVDGEVLLTAQPSSDVALSVALEAAAAIAHARPSSGLLDFLGAAPVVAWTDDTSSAFRRVVEVGNARSWRFLETVGILDRALPELAETMRVRRADPFLPDPTSTHRFATLERLRSLEPGSPLRGEYDRLQHPEWLLLAALLVDALAPITDRDAAEAKASAVVRRIGLGATAERHVSGLVSDDGLLRSAAMRLDAPREDKVLELASHLDSPEQARAAFLLAAAADDDDPEETGRLTLLHEMLQRSLADDVLHGVDGRNLVERCRTEALTLARGRSGLAERIVQAPRGYLVRQQPAAVVRHAELTAAPMSADTVRVTVAPADAAGSWRVEVGALDRPGLLAAVTGVLADASVDVDAAVVSTWFDGTAIESFVVRAPTMPEPDTLAAAIRTAFDEPMVIPGINGAEVAFDDVASPWHTVCTVNAPDSIGVLHNVSAVFAAAGVEVVGAGIGHRGSVAIDRFEVVGAEGPRLTQAERDRIATYLRTGVRARRRRLGRGLVVEAA